MIEVPQAAVAPAVKTRDGPLLVAVVVSKARRVCRRAGAGVNVDYQEIDIAGIAQSSGAAALEIDRDVGVVVRHTQDAVANGTAEAGVGVAGIVGGLRQVGGQQQAGSE